MTSRVEHLPSIALVLDSNQAHSSLRLPAYRVSHRLRYHPYPRYASSRPQDIDFITANLHTEPLWSESPLPPVEENAEIANLDQALAISGIQSENPFSRARSLSTLVIDLAFAVTRKLVNLVRV